MKSLSINQSAAEADLDPLQPSNPSLTADASLSWSPDNTRFAFTRSHNSEHTEIVISGMTDSALVSVGEPNSRNAQPAWSPLADRIAIVSLATRQPTLALANPNDGSLQIVTDGGDAIMHPRWSPLGTQLVATLGDTDRHDIGLLELNAKRRAWRTLTKNGRDNLSPSFSPNGQKLAFYSSIRDKTNISNWAIVVIDTFKLGIANSRTNMSNSRTNTRGIVARNVIPDWNHGPAWMPDGLHLVYVQQDRNRLDPIVITNINTRQTRELRTQTRLNRDISVSRQGRIAFSTQEHVWSGVYVADARLDKQ